MSAFRISTTDGKIHEVNCDDFYYNTKYEAAVAFVNEDEVNYRVVALFPLHAVIGIFVEEKKAPGSGEAEAASP